MVDSCVHCEICGCECSFLFELYDDRYGYPGTFKLYKCGGCGHGVIPVDFSEEQITDLYSNYYPRSTFNVENFKPYSELKGFNAWFNGSYCNPFRLVPKNVRVLDIGCGFGEALGYYEARGCDAYGVETDENIIRASKEFGYNVHVGLFDPDAYEPGFFDYVTMAQVLEHVVDPVETLKGVAKVLKPEGCLVLSTPNAKGWGARVFGKKWINWHAPYHIQCFTGKSIKNAAENAGLVVEKLKTTTSSEWLFYQWMHIFTYPTIRQPSVFWSPKAEMTLTQKVIAKLISFFHLIKVNHIITRLFDLINVGDNLVVILRKP